MLKNFFFKTFRGFYLALIALLGLCGAVSVANYTMTQGAGTSFGSVVIGGTVHYAQQLLCDLTTPAQCAAVSAGGAVKVDNSAVTQPISGTITANAGTGTRAISAASGAMASGSVASGAMVDLGSQADAACGTASGTCSLIALQKFNNIATSGAIPLNVNTVATAQTGLTPSVSQTGTIIAANVDLTSKGGVAFGAMANYGTSPGAVKVDGVNAFVTNTVSVNAQAAATGGATPSFVVAAATNNSTNLKASAGTVYSIQTSNINTTTAYFIKLYDKATAPTCGTDTPVAAYVIPPSNGGNNVTLTVGKKFTLGIGYCIVTGIANNDNTSVPAATILANVDWN